MTGGGVRQFEVVLGGQRYFVDLAYPARRLAIELDGVTAHGGNRFQTDRTRQNAPVLAGWTVLRFTWADVTERPDRVVAAIRLALAA
ncbi:MAG: endonuclease domain-containing protein [Acidimicrobiales bacterium]